MKKISLIVLLLFLIPSFTEAQKEYKRKISINQWIKEMKDCKEDIYLLEDTEIYFESGKNTHSYNKTDSLPAVDTIFCRAEMHNCKFPLSSFALASLHFKKYVLLMDCKINNLNVFNSSFDEGLELVWGSLGMIFFKNCTFSDIVEVYEAELSVFQFEKCTFNTKDQDISSYVNINEPNMGYKSVFNIASPNDERRIKMFNLDSCQIHSEKVIPVFNILLANFNSISFTNTNFENTIINFQSSAIDKSFVVEDCKINQPMGMENFSFPEKGTNFHWGQIEGVGIAIYNGGFGGIYKAETDSQLTQINKYNELVSSYKQMYSTYRVRGDMESANNCYIAMKDVETRRLAYLYGEKKNLTSFFNWKLNQFLKFFCKYGTSPIRALLISLWVILGFALIYFFFDSEWDKINRTYLMNRYKALLSYFQSDKKLADYYGEKYNVELDTYKEFKHYLKSSEGNIPKFMLWIGKPLYRFPTTRRMLTRYIYSKIEILDGEWNSLKPKKRIYVNLITAIVIILFVIYAFVAKAINSLFLSINTFSTLGFGSIPVKGISRYLAILQGFLGWFLLSIFSVSLINQILQS